MHMRIYIPLFISFPSATLPPPPGLYTQGVYRKSAGAASKKAVRTLLEEGSLTSDIYFTDLTIRK